MGIQETKSKLEWCLKFEAWTNTWDGWILLRPEQGPGHDEYLKSKKYWRPPTVPIQIEHHTPNVEWISNI